MLGVPLDGIVRAILTEAEMLDVMKDMWDDGWVGRAMLALIIFVFALILLAIRGSIVEQREWEVFASAHECKIVGRMRGDTQTGIGVGITPNGQMGTVVTTSSTPDKTGYACNDGVTYWR